MEAFSFLLGLPVVFFLKEGWTVFCISSLVTLLLYLSNVLFMYIPEMKNTLLSEIIEYHLKDNMICNYLVQFTKLVNVMCAEPLLFGNILIVEYISCDGIEFHFVFELCATVVMILLCSFIEFSNISLDIQSLLSGFAFQSSLELSCSKNLRKQGTKNLSLVNISISKLIKYQMNSILKDVSFPPLSVRVTTISMLVSVFFLHL